MDQVQPQPHSPNIGTESPQPSAPNPSPNPSPTHHPYPHMNHRGEEKSLLSGWAIVLIVALGILVVLNQIFLVGFANSITGSSFGSMSSHISLGGDTDLKDVDINSIQNTAQGIQVLFPIDDISTPEDAIAVIIPSGTPDYGEAMGVSYDDPVSALDVMAKAYPALNQQLQENPELWERYLNLAAEPRGVSCEFCCGIGPQGVDANGRSRCGCAHNPGVLTATQWLLLNTDYSDAEILREVYRWKALWFPRDMVGLASQIAGGDTSALHELPGMVGGC